MTPEQAYPGISFRPRTRNWLARLMRVPPECVHLEEDVSWMAMFHPDTLYLRGKAAVQRRPARPMVSLCRACLLEKLEAELASHGGRVVAFEPDGSEVSQYFFVGAPEFPAAGLKPETAAAITRRLRQPMGDCERCEQPAKWLWFSREHVPSLDETHSIAMARGEALCARHGADKLCESLAKLSEANLFYVNVPYGDAGAYLWI
jgi:hypothetical protein